LYDLAARTSRAGRTVLIATAEDHLHAVARPRLEAAGADLDKVRAIVDPIGLPDDGDRITDWVDRWSASLVIVDPLVAFIGGKVDTDRDHQVRSVLAPLAAMAESRDAAFVTVVHANKNIGANPLLRVGGSIGLVGAARVVLLAAKHPEDESRRVLAVLKNNLAEHASTIEYSLDGVMIGEDIPTVRVSWLGELPEVKASSLLRESEVNHQALDDAKGYLESLGLTDGMVLPSKEVENGAAANGIGRTTLHDARRALGIPTRREGFGRGGTWLWGSIDSEHARSGSESMAHAAETAPSEPIDSVPASVNVWGGGSDA
jgi:hypothetical protein